MDDRWSDRLAGMRITTSGAEGYAPVTTLIGNLRDQAQLSGVLNSLYDLHLPILLVQFIQEENGIGPAQDLSITVMPLGPLVENDCQRLYTIKASTGKPTAAISGLSFSAVVLARSPRSAKRP